MAYRWPSDQRGAVTRLAQYLAGLTTQQDEWDEIGSALVALLGTDLVAFAMRDAQGDLVTHHWAAGEGVNAVALRAALRETPCRGALATVRSDLEETLSSGFLATGALRQPDLPEAVGPGALAMAYLPITQESKVVAALMVAHATDEPMPREMMDLYLAIGGIVGSITARLASERELGRHRRHLQKLVDERTAELTASNRQLAQEIAQRTQAEARISHLNQVLHGIHRVSQIAAVETDRQRLIQSVCDHLLASQGYDNAWIALTEPNGRVVTIAERGLGAPFEAVAQGLREGRMPDCGRLAMTRPEVVVRHAPHTQCADCPLAPDYLGRGGMVVRLAYGGRVYGLLCASMPAELTGDEQEQLLLREVAGDIAVALHNLEAEAQRQQMESVLEQSEARYRAFFDSTEDMVYIKDSALRYLLVNRANQQFFGRPLDEILGRGDAELLPPEVAARCRKSDEQVIAGAALVVNHETVRDRVYETRKFPVSLGDEVGVGAFIRDITAAVRDQEQRERLQKELIQAQRLEAVGRLAGGIAHEFNNMLAVILGHAELAMGEMDPSEPLYQDLLDIRKAGRRSAELTRQLLAFSRRQTVSPRVIDLNEVSGQAVPMLRRMVGDGITLSWMPAPTVWPIRIDPIQIDQMLTQLCGNAGDAIDDIGRIEIETRNVRLSETDCADHPDCSPGEYVMLRVSDDGCGMDQETLAHAFEPFYTTKEVGQGSGLGLAMIHGIVKQNGCSLVVESEVGVGTTFRLYFPRHVAPDAHPDATQEGGETAPAPKTILLVDDEQTILKMTQSMLQRLGYAVLSAQSPHKAIEIAAETPGTIDLLMTDIHMPELSGIELSQQIVHMHPQTQCLFMSGYAVDDLESNGIALDGKPLLVKPFGLGQLAARVREALGEA